MASASADLRKSWRAARSSPGFYGVAATNLLPLIGLAFLRWRMETLILFYLLECSVVLIVTAKMLAFVAEDRKLPQELSRQFLIGGGVCLVAMGAFWGYILGWFKFVRVDAGWILGFALSAAFMAASHVYSYLHNFVGRKEHERLPVRAIQAGWGRYLAGTVVVMLLFPLLMLFDSPVPFVSALVLVKTLTALSAFVEERARAEGSEATSIAYTRPTATCPRCHQLLRTDQAKQCFHCGADWHKSAA